MSVPAVARKQAPVRTRVPRSTAERSTTLARPLSGLSTADHIKLREAQYQNRLKLVAAGLKRPGEKLVAKAAGGGDRLVFEKLINTSKLDYVRAIRENKRITKRYPTLKAFGEMLKALIPTLLKARFGKKKRGQDLLKLMQQLAIGSKVDRAVVQLICIWQVASGEKSIDGWLGGRSYRKIGQQKSGPKKTTELDRLFARHVRRRLNFARAKKKNKTQMSANGATPAELDRYLRPKLATLIGKKFAGKKKRNKKRRQGLLLLLKSLPAVTTNGKHLTMLLALWQVTGKGSVDGWFGGRSYRRIGWPAEQQRKIIKADEPAKKKRDATLSTLVKASGNKTLTAMLPRLKELELKMGALEATTAGKKTSDDVIKAHNISKTHANYRRYKEISNAERIQFRRFIKRSRLVLGGLKASAKLPQASLDQLKALLYRRLNALSAYWTQMAGGKHLNKIFGGKRGRYQQWEVTCHYHSTAMAMEAMGKGAADFTGDWDKLLAVARKIDNKRYADTSKLRALRLPELLMLVSLFSRCGENPAKVNQARKVDSWGFQFPVLASYFGLQSKFPSDKPHLGMARRKERKKSEILAEVLPLLKSGQQVLLNKVGHFMRLQHLDNDYIIVDDPWTLGKNWRMTWAEGKKYFRRYAVLKEDRSYEKLVGWFDRGVATRRKLAAAMAKQGATAAELDSKLRADIVAKLATHSQKTQLTKLLAALTPHGVDEALVKLVGLWQKLKTNRAPNGWQLKA